MKPRDLLEVDVDFENLIARLRRCKENIGTGHIRLDLDVVSGVQAGCEVVPTPETRGDLDRLMRGKPGWDR